VDRRTFLRASGAAALGFSVGGCAPALAGRRDSWRAPFTLAPIEVDPGRIIRTTVGLRPSRDTGFVVRAEGLDGKTVIHNYGHGGAGMTLSWGTAHLAADLALAHPDRRAAVLGCGIAGLTAARVLQRRGFDVTIYSEALPPETTSNRLWGGFTPTAHLVTRRSPEWDTQFRRAIDIAYREHQLLVGRGYGVSWINSYVPTDNPPAGSRGAPGAADRLLPDSATIGSDLLREGEHPFRTRYARRFPMIRFEPAIYLDALMRDVLTFGGRIVVRSFDSPRDLLQLDETLLVNCTGLGARKLFGDEELTPVKGQLTILLPQPEVDYSIGGIIPRHDGIVIGHTAVRGDWSLEIDPEAERRALESAMRDAATLRTTATATPPPARTTAPAEVPPVESFFGFRS
jgi:D-amino-acid oxidase